MQVVRAYLGRMGHQPVTWESSARALETPFLAIIECTRDQATEAAIRAARHAGLRALAVVRDSSEELAIWALRSGFVDYMRCPLAWEAFRSAMETHRAASETTSATRFAAVSGTSQILGESAPIRDVRERIPRIAASDSTVLILGETGTGKELVAASIHKCSRRNQGPFVPVNCAAIPDTLLENELFGHQRGSFTGAVASQSGLMRQASGGTLFLDEIGELSAPAQAKLLRAIETRSVVPLGGGKPVPLDIRIVAATNQRLESLALSNSFRRDLFFRLNVISISLPALRERSGDVELLIEHYLGECRRRFGSRARSFSSRAMELLRNYDWPGNVRELANLVEASVVNAASGSSEHLELPHQFCSLRVSAAPLDERQRLVEALYETHWNISRTARRLNWSRMTVYRKMADYEIHRHAAVSTA